MKVRVLGAGIAGQVLHRELCLRGIESELVERAAFPREKVCGGVLQPDSWRYLNRLFHITDPFLEMRSISHIWRGRRLSKVPLKEPLIFIPRLTLDHALFKQQQHGTLKAPEALEIDATGVGAQTGEWLGFQSRCEKADGLEMHYAEGIYLGLCPTLERDAHAAFIVKKDYFKNPKDLKERAERELGVRFTAPLKGTGQIHYGYSPRNLAIGDAKLTTHPFLGLGMKHAMLSAKLMADCIERGQVQTFSRQHARAFSRIRRVSALTGRLYDSPLRAVLKPFLKYELLFRPIYRWIHGAGDIPRTGSGG